MQASNQPIVIIPEPCHESWEKMTPTQTGRHCNSCEKTVVDFTAMSNDEIIVYLSERKQERVCGRFEGKQVRQPVVVTAQYLVSGHWSVTQAIRLAIFIVFSSSLFSCTNAQTGKIEKTQILIEDQVSSQLVEEIMVGEPDMHPPPLVTFVEGGAEIMGDIALSQPAQNCTPEITARVDSNYRRIMGGLSRDILPKDDSVLTFTLGKVAFTVAETRTAPVYPGGESELNYFMKTNLRYPAMEHEKMIQGTLNVRFTISEKGEVANCEVLNTIPGARNFEAEIKRVTSKMPAWKPATTNGKEVEGVYVLPVRFRLGD